MTERSLSKNSIFKRNHSLRDFYYIYWIISIFIMYTSCSSSTLLIKMENKTRLINFAFGIPLSVTHTVISCLNCKQYLVKFQSKTIKFFNWNLKTFSGSSYLNIEFCSFFKQTLLYVYVMQPYYILKTELPRGSSISFKND